MKPKARTLLRCKRKPVSIMLSREAHERLAKQATARHLSRSRLLELLIHATPIEPEATS